MMETFMASIIYIIGNSIIASSICIRYSPDFGGGYRNCPAYL